MSHKREAESASTVHEVVDDLVVIDPASGDVYRLRGLQALIARRLLEEDATSATVRPIRMTTTTDAERPRDPVLTVVPQCGDQVVLAERETRILQLVADGHSNEAIASMLHFSVATVRRTTTSLYRRLGARNRASAIARAHELRLLG